MSKKKREENAEEIKNEAVETKEETAEAAPEKTETDLLKEELARKYYAQQIKTILSVKERYGFSYWKVITSENRTVNFTMQDTFRNIIRVGEDKAVLLDVDGNRFMLDSIAALDRKSYKKIELYL